MGVEEREGGEQGQVGGAEEGVGDVCEQWRPEEDHRDVEERRQDQREQEGEQGRLGNMRISMISHCFKDIGGVDMAAYNDKAGAGPVAGLLLLAGLVLPVLWRAGPSCREAQKGVDDLQEGDHGQRGRHGWDGVSDKVLEACAEEARYYGG